MVEIKSHDASLIGLPSITLERAAHIATFTQVRDGRIYRHATYDCYEPISA
jgi:hypothetical protein